MGIQWRVVWQSFRSTYLWFSFKFLPSVAVTCAVANRISSLAEASLTFGLPMLWVRVLTGCYSCRLT